MSKSLDSLSLRSVRNSIIKLRTKYVALKSDVITLKDTCSRLERRVSELESNRAVAAHKNLMGGRNV